MPVVNVGTAQNVFAALKESLDHKGLNLGSVFPS